MAKDRREDAGQFYPGGSVIPRGPVTPGGGGGTPSDYAEISEKAKAGAAHAANPTPHVSDTDRASWNEKQDKLSDTQLTNISAVPNKRDKTDMYTEWSIGGYTGSIVRNVSITRIIDDTHFEVTGEYASEYDIYPVWQGPVTETLTVRDGSLRADGGPFEATRQRILTTDDIETSLTNPTEGKAAEAAAVKTALEGKADGVAFLPAYLPLTSTSTNLVGAYFQFDGVSYNYRDKNGGTLLIFDINGVLKYKIAQDIKFNGNDVPVGTEVLRIAASKSDIADATKLTPVYVGTVETDLTGVFTVAIEVRTQGAQKLPFVVIYRNGYQFYYQNFVEGVNEYKINTPDGVVKAVISIVGYKLGDKTAETDPTLNGMSADDITTLAEAAIKGKAMPTEDAVEGSVSAKIMALETAITGVAADLAEAIGEEA